MPTRSESPGELRVAVITPYYRESLEMLRLCHDSVRTQTYPCTHFLIADGHPNQEIASWSVQHLILPQPHGDDGNTPRCLGSLSAMKQGFDVITFLDADNWYYPNHLEALLLLQRQTGAAVCTATRTLHRLDGSLMYVDRHDCDGKRHVDTNCLFLTRPAFRILPLWTMIPRQLYALGDNLFWQALLASGLKTARNVQPTVAYRTPYQVHYRNIGEPAPAGAKSNEETSGKAQRWWHALPEEERQEWSRYLTSFSGTDRTNTPLNVQ